MREATQVWRLKRGDLVVPARSSEVEPWVVDEAGPNYFDGDGWWVVLRSPDGASTQEFKTSLTAYVWRVVNRWEEKRIE